MVGAYAHAHPSPAKCSKKPYATTREATGRPTETSPSYYKFNKSLLYGSESIQSQIAIVGRRDFSVRPSRHCRRLSHTTAGLLHESVAYYPDPVCRDCVSTREPTQNPIVVVVVAATIAVLLPAKLSVEFAASATDII